LDFTKHFPSFLRRERNRRERNARSERRRRELVREKRRQLQKLLMQILK
jgi:hypothetical protein